MFFILRVVFQKYFFMALYWFLNADLRKTWLPNSLPTSIAIPTSI